MVIGKKYDFYCVADTFTYIFQASRSRFGDLSFREQRITTHMLNVLKTDLVSVDLSFTRYDVEDGRSTPLERLGRKSCVTSNAIVNLQVRVANTGGSSGICISSSERLIPVYRIEL